MRLYVGLAVSIVVIAGVAFMAGSFGVFPFPWGEAPRLEQANVQLQGKIEALQKDLRIEEGRSEVRLLDAVILATIIKNKGNGAYAINHPQDPKQQVVIKVEGSDVTIEGVGTYSEAFGRTGVSFYFLSD